MKQPDSRVRRRVIYAAAIRDASGVRVDDGAVLAEAGCVVAVCERRAVAGDFLADARVTDLGDCLLLPAMVNAHTHLGLTAIGPRPYAAAGGFIGWVNSLREHEPKDRQAKRASYERGWAMSVSGGVQAVGDIVSSEAGVSAEAQGLSGTGLSAVSYLECFGLGPPFDAAALAKIDTASSGLQPHAPYSAGPGVYEAAARSGLPVSTHLAETREELRFVSKGDGPWRDYLQAIGRWHDMFAEYYGKGLSPVGWMRPYLAAAADAGGWLVAHANYVDDQDLAILADTNTSVAYCPIASAYFGHGLARDSQAPPHRYQDMLDHGINVCLGTDSIIGTDPDDPQPLGLLGAMRLLYRRDQADPDTLLAMATTHGARALRLDEKVATLRPGASARFVTIPIDPQSPAEALNQMLAGRDPLEPLSFDVDPDD